MGKNAKTSNVKIVAIHSPAPTIAGFYGQVASVAGLSLEETKRVRYDCRYLEVATSIRDSIFESMRENGYSSLDMASVWMNIGPKTADDLEDGEVRIYPGFFITQGVS